jgi:large subunit ribosomal protein L31e
MKEEEKEEPQTPEEERTEQQETAETQRTDEVETAEEEKVETETEEEMETERKKEEAKAPAEGEKEEAPSREKEEEGIVEERTYTVPLGKAWIMPPRKRAARAMRMLRSFIIKHMKLGKHKEGETEEEEEPQKLVITNEVNEKIWARGIEKPPRKIRVRAAVDKDGNVTVHLAEGE